MSVIRVLPEDLSNRIAAGEVIERPASVVKELVENALDAGATAISVSVERGGTALVRVVDNGRGMDEQDALLCLEAHATSKIRDDDDISRIATFGFRGEAIPSIASVSRFQLQTRPADAEHGCSVLVHGGVVQEVKPVGGAPGTTVTVRDLFYNVPARRKFLRALATEERHIEDTVLLVALANPHVAFDLTFGNRNALSARPANDLRTRAAMLLGRELAAAMLPVDHQRAGIRVHGLAAEPGLTRTGRRDQRAFVNCRPVTADTVYRAVRDAYHALLTHGRHPPVLLFIDLPPDRVDVNVHPAKREIRFREDRLVQEIVTEALRQTLRHHLAPQPAAAHEPPRLMPLGPPQPPPRLRTPQILPVTPLPSPASPNENSERTPAPPPPARTAAQSGPNTATATPPASTAPPAPPAQPESQSQQLRVLGRIHDYLVAEGPRGIVLVDQRAAHERVLFERILRQVRHDTASQGLLIPVTVDLAGADAELLRDQADRFRDIGFGIDHFGGNTFLITAIPAHLPHEDLTGLLRDIIDDLRDNAPPARRQTAERIAQATCRVAVRNRQRLTDTEVHHLLDELLQTEMPYTCPAGRPTMINLSLAEIEKRFGKR